MRDLEIVVAFLERLPESVPLVTLEALELLVRHAERKGVDLDGGLPAVERVAREPVDLLGERVRHGIAAGRLALAVHHDGAAGAIERPVVGVGIAEVEGEIILRIGLHLVAGDRVEALGRLLVALLSLGPSSPDQLQMG